MKARIFYIVSCGLVLAVIIHIIIILLIPNLGARDAAKQIVKNLPDKKFQFIGNGKGLGIANSDPHLQLSVCKFDLDETAVEIKGPSIPTFWSASVFDERGRVIYSLNDRIAIKNKLQMIIVNPIQMADIRQLQPGEIETSILVEAQNPKGFVLLRALIPNPSWETKTVEFLKSAECVPYSTSNFTEAQTSE